MKSLTWSSVVVCLVSLFLLSQTGPTLTVSAAPGQGVPFQTLQQQVDLMQSDLDSSRLAIAELQTQLESTTGAFETLQAELGEARELIAEQNETLQALRSRMRFDTDGSWIGWSELTVEGPTLFRDPESGAAVAIHASGDAILTIDPAPLDPGLAALSIVGEARFWSTTDPVDPTVRLNGVQTRDPLIDGVLSEPAVIEIHGGLVSANAARDTAIFLNFLFERPLSVMLTGPEAGIKYEAFLLGVPEWMRPEAFLQTTLIRAHEFSSF